MGSKDHSAMAEDKGRDKPRATRPPCPLNDVSLFQRLFFGWAWPVLKLGATRPLVESDLPELHRQETSAANLDYYMRLWESCRGAKGGNLGRALLKDYVQTTRFPQLLVALNSASKIVQALAMGMLLDQFSDEDGTISTKVRNRNSYVWCAVLIGCGFITFLSKQQLLLETYRKGMQIHIGLCGLLFDKILRISSTSTSDCVSAGKITNLASNDVARYQMAAISTIWIIVVPIEAVVILIIGVRTLGPTFAIGHALLLGLIPIQLYLSRCFVKFRRKVASFTDARVTLVSQAVSGARLMKMNGWELEFEARISALRAKEVQILKTASRFKALNDAIYFSSSSVVASIIFTVHVFLGNELSPRIVYTTMTLLNILHYSITKHLPNSMMHLSEGYVSSERIQTFLEVPDASSLVMKRDKPIGSQPVITFANVSCIWGDNKQVDEGDTASASALSDVSLSFKAGKLNCVSGKVGSGKSALLLSLAGELAVVGGTVTRSYSSLAYASQTPWIMNGSVRENIIMDQSFRQDWYDKVIDACGLRLDLSLFVHGDKTVVGDRGIQISGGQKARVGLARAFYKDTDILLLDDPLAAVDSSVAKSIFQLAIVELGVNRGKCVVLATHHHQLVQTGHCVVVERGRVASTDLTESPASFITEAAGEVMEEEDTTYNEEENHDCTGDDIKQMEARRTGIINWATWLAYGEAAGGWSLCIFFFVSYASTQTVLLLLQVEMGIWSEAPAEQQKSPQWIGLVLGLSLLCAILSMIRAVLSYRTLIHASKRLHNHMLRSVLRSKIEFYDTSPLGRILNRFSADVGICDERLTLTIYDFLVGAFIVCGGIVTATVVLPFILIALPFLVWLFIKLRRIFVLTTRELKRLEGIARSPMYAIMAEAVDGISTIRGNGCIGYFKSKFDNAQDEHTRAHFCFAASSRWFATQMDILSFTLMALASILAVLFNSSGWFMVDPAVLGLTLTLLIQIAGTNFPWVVRQSAEVVNQMTSVERVIEYGKLAPEAPIETTKDKVLDESWPSAGGIEVRDLSVKYRAELPCTLDGATFSIPAGSRVGIVGRTGAGKSTIVQALFRLLEAERGVISIDGVDISEIGLHRLRKNLSVIPQTPTLFSGCTIRDNLDLFGDYSDEDIQTSLAEVHMDEAIMELPLGLNAKVSDDGSNFSVGQRQLLCLARANLKKSRILIMDEATASVDKLTDQRIHESLTKLYKEATVLKVAHRLDTVIEDDLILVFSSGKVVEYGSPAELLHAKGAFYAMVQDTDHSEDLTVRAFEKKT